MLSNPYKRYRVKWNMGPVHHGSRDTDSLTEAQEYFVLCFNQCYEGDNGHNLRIGLSKVQLFESGNLLIDTAKEAAKS